MFDAQHTPAAKQAYSIREIAALTSIGRTKIFSEISAGRLVARKFGRRTIVLANDLNQWLADLPAVQ